MTLKQIVKDRGIDKNYLISSCATSFEEIGNSIYPPARAVLRKHGIDIEPHRAVRMTSQDYREYDLIIAMDKYNVRNINYIIGEDKFNKVKLFKEFCGMGNSDVVDPWYTENFDLCFDEINKLCHYLVDILEQ